jgi:hypothetical protein
MNSHVVSDINISIYSGKKVIFELMGELSG